MRIGEQLKHLRIKHGLTQAALGEKVGVTFQMIQHLEGSDDMKAHRLVQLATVLNEPLSAFLGEEVREIGALADDEQGVLARYRALPSEDARKGAEQLLQLDEEGKQLAAIWSGLSEDGRAEVMGEALKQQRREHARRK